MTVDTNRQLETWGGGRADGLGWGSWQGWGLMVPNAEEGSGDEEELSEGGCL